MPIEPLSAPEACVLAVLLQITKLSQGTSGYAMWVTAGGAIRIGHYDVITRKL